jgi:hypothetical protein
LPSSEFIPFPLDKELLKDYATHNLGLQQISPWRLKGTWIFVQVAGLMGQSERGAVAILRKTPWMFVFFIFTGGLLGGVLGEILRALSPDGVIRDLFLIGFDPGINPPFTLNLHLISLTVGFTVRVNLLTLLGMILGIYIYKQA